MKNAIGILAVILVFCSCQKREHKPEPIGPENFTSTQIDSILGKFNFQYESPILIDSTDQFVIPISTELLESKKRYSNDGYETDEFPRYWNVLFYNKKSGKTNLLTEDKFRISDIYAQSDEYSKYNKFIKGKILYRIGDTDFNDDNKLNRKDPDFLFISEIDGSNLQRISPPDENLYFYQVIPNSNQILIQAQRDTNKDSIFSSHDETIWYMAEEINNEWKISEIINSSLKEKIENLYFEQWLKKK